LSANLILAHHAGIRVLVTGGVGSLGHANIENALDVPDELVQLSRIPVAVVSAGAKGVLALHRTVDILESFGVPVVGYGTDSLPALYVRDTSHRVSARVDTPAEAAEFAAAHWALEGAGVLLAQPAPREVALDPAFYGQQLLEIERQAASIHSRDLTPFLTSRLARLTRGKTLAAYKAILTVNATLGARIASQLTEGGRPVGALEPSAPR
jgi:pseudouridine-5'-phosphate glycosidase